MTDYATTVQALAYLTASGRDEEWGAVADPAAALHRATMYIDARYRKQYPSGRWVSQFSGTKVGGRTQPEEWPRKDATDYYGDPIDYATIPDEVVNATIEAALREGMNPGSLLPDYDPAADRLPTSEQVGDLKVSYGNQMTYKNVTNETVTVARTSPTIPVIPAIDMIIAPVLTGGGDLVAMNVIR